MSILRVTADKGANLQPIVFSTISLMPQSRLERLFWDEPFERPILFEIAFFNCDTLGNSTTNIPSLLMTPSQLPSRYFQGLDYQKLSFDPDGWHFDASGVVPLQRYLEVAIYKLVKKRTEQSALHSV